MERSKKALLKLSIINERFLTSVLKTLSANTILSKKLLSNVEYLLEVIDINFYTKDPNVYSLLQAIQIAVKYRQSVPEYNSEELLNVVEVIISNNYEKQKKDLIIPIIKLGASLKQPTEITFVNKTIETELVTRKSRTTSSTT